jgi:predicted enzyme related to lactoylglutathione lyase
MAQESNPVGWFDIPVRDMQRAKGFYEHVLGVQLSEHEHDGMRMAFFPMEEKAYGAAGMLAQGEDYQPSENGVLIYFSVKDIPAALARAEEKGGEVVLQRTSIGEWGYIGVIHDSEGNHVGLHSMA